MFFELAQNSRILAFCYVFLINFLSISFAQSTCNYMKQFEHLDLNGMPPEPVVVARNASSVCMSSQSRNNQTGGSTITCCTAGIEMDMQRFARLNLEKNINNQLLLLRDFFQDYSKTLNGLFLILSIISLENIRMALQMTHQKLNKMFQKTYGSFYFPNAQIFNEFFTELDLQFYNMDLELNFPSLLQNLFSKIYLAEFALLNPLRQITTKKSVCILEMYSKLRPFGMMPRKIQTLFGRSLKSWKTLLRSIQKIIEIINKIIPKTSLSNECTLALTRMNQCHICSGQNPYAKPCLNYCLNVLKGCFAEMTEIDPQFNFFTETLIKVAVRLKNVHNPYNTMNTVPVQISEAIMLFQENGHRLSSRILLECFRAENRPKRQTYNKRIVRKAPLEWSYYEEQPKNAKHFQSIVNTFLDKLIRIKNFWRKIPNFICQDGQMAASSTDSCWNGERIDYYPYRVIGDGVHRQRQNPEYANTYKGDNETFYNERIELAIVAKRLLISYENHNDNPESYSIEGSALENLAISADDEDFGSGFLVIQSTKQPNDNFIAQKFNPVKIIRLNQQGLNSSYSIQRISTPKFVYILLSFLAFRYL